MAERDYERALHGVSSDPFVGGGPAVATPSPITHDPTQGRGTDAWQQALRMGLQVNARNRRN